MIKSFLNWIKGKKDCQYCGKTFDSRAREKKMDEEGIDSEADVNLLFFCSKECSYKDIECMSLIDQMEFEKKKYGFITDETIRKSKEFKKHG